MKVIVMKTVSSRLAALGLVALVGPLGVARAQAVETAVQPTPQTILNAISALQTTVNTLQTKVDNLQSASIRLQANVQSIQSTVPPSWSQTLPGAARFVPALDGAAVLDLETGLVWEKSPNQLPSRWTNAHNRCSTNFIAGRMGWRLPTVEELTSLVDPTQITPALPVGHPFSGVQPNGLYWSSTGFVGDSGADTQDNSDLARLVTFGQSPNGPVRFGTKIEDRFIWCVRGGQQADAQ